MSEEGANQFWHSQMLEPRPLSETGNYFVDRSQEIGAAEVILPAESRLIGRTVLEARICSEYGLIVIGLRHGSKVVAQGLPERLKIGDTLLLIGFRSDIRDLQSNDDIVVLKCQRNWRMFFPQRDGRRTRCGTGTGGRVDDQRRGAERPGRADWQPSDGAFGLRRFRQRLPIHQQEEPDPDRRNVAVLAGLAADGRGRPRCRRGGRLGRRHRAASGVGALFVVTAMLGLFISNTATAVLTTPVALAIAKDLGALSVCNDRRAGRVRGFHDAYFLTGEHAAGGTRAI
jgi:hypothetical protein